MCILCLCCTRWSPKQQYNLQDTNIFGEFEKICVCDFEQTQMLRWFCLIYGKGNIVNINSAVLHIGIRFRVVGDPCPVSPRIFVADANDWSVGSFYTMTFNDVLF